MCPPVVVHQRRAEGEPLAVGQQQGFDRDDNALHVIWEQGEQQLALTGKAKLARQLVAIIAKHFEIKTRQGKVIKIHAKDSA